MIIRYLKIERVPKIENSVFDAYRTKIENESI